jgi:hypothetical protein
MAFERLCIIGATISFTSLMVTVPAYADIIITNCTGMLNLDRYEFDTDQPEQDVAGIGPSTFSMDEQEIRLLGNFGEYRFDLNVGTLYHNGTDTGLYCTYGNNDN